MKQCAYLSEAFFDLSRTMAREALVGAYPWEVLASLAELIRALSGTLSRDDYTEISPGVFLARDVRVSPTATILAPCIVGRGSEIRSGAYLRGATLIGEGCVIGNASEVKGSILFDGVKAPHYNYIGDSVLGADVHLGAGAVLSNLRCDRAPVVLRTSPPLPTGRKKLGAILGDGCEIGCHAVLNPGTLLGRGSIVYPLSSVCGVHAAGARLCDTRRG